MSILQLTEDTGNASGLIVTMNGTSGQITTTGDNSSTITLSMSTCYIAGITGKTVTGSAVLCSTAGLLGTVVSSIRFKENVEDMGYASNDVLKLRPVTFDYIKNPEMGRQTGLIAEEVLEVMPNLVIIGLDGLPETVKYHELPVLLLNEIIKLKKRIEVLEAKWL